MTGPPLIGKHGLALAHGAAFGKVGQTDNDPVSKDRRQQRRLFGVSHRSLTLLVLGVRLRKLRDNFRNRFNEAIREAAAREGAVLADVEAAFDAASEGAPGWLFFDEHVHPSLRGQALLEGDEAGFSRAMMAVAENIDRAPAAQRVYLRELPDAPAWTNITTRLSAVLASTGHVAGGSSP